MMKKKILFVVDNLVMGGVTKVLVNLINRFDFEKYEVDLLVLHYYDDMEVEISEKVNLLKGGSSYKYIDKTLGQIISEKNIKALLGKMKLVFLLKTGLIKGVIKKSRKKILAKKYDTEIAFNDGFTEVFVANGDTPKKIAWMHTDISVYNDSSKYKKLILQSLEKMDMCVGVSKKIMQAYMEYYGLKKFCVIHNILDADSIIEKSKEQFDNPFKDDVVNLVSVGRLCMQKNYGAFVRVHKRLTDEGYNIRSYIVGDGLEREGLERLIKENGVSESFVLLGRKDNPFPYVKNADIFVLSSLCEGLPTVLYESIILGTPCVSTRVAGADEILENKYGLVTENSDDGLYEGLKSVLDSGNDNAFRENLKEYKFDYKEIIQQVENIL
jgi:glycosyltransferase involved in cell wall biosynthesis